MSLYPGPYITLSPPPTAGPLPVIERANLNTPYSGGGGGGGISTIGPNPVVSSITLGGANPVVNMANNGFVITAGGFDITSTIVGIEYNPTAPGGGGIGGPDFTIIQAGTLNTFPVWNLALGGDGRSELVLNSTMSIVGDSVNISSLNVSSINGAAPGGGGGAPPAVVSTISSLVNVSTINVGSPGLLTIAGGVSVLDYVGAGSISTGSIVSITPGGTVSVQSLNTSSITSAANQINVTVPTSISSLSVSSINGAAPGGGSAPFFSSIKIPGTLSTFVCDPGATTILVPFSTTAGHVYSATAYIRAQVFEVAGNGDTVYTEILDNAIGNEAFGNWSAQIVSTITGGGSLQYVGGTVTWKAGGTNAALSCVPSVSTSLKIDALNLIDFGAV